MVDVMIFAPRRRSPWRDLEGGLDPRSDAAILASGHPTLTSISAVGEAPMPAMITAESS